MLSMLSVSCLGVTVIEALEAALATSTPPMSSTATAISTSHKLSRDERRGGGSIGVRTLPLRSSRLSRERKDGRLGTEAGPVGWRGVFSITSRRIFRSIN